MCSLGGAHFGSNFLTPLVSVLTPVAYRAARRGSDVLREKAKRVFGDRTELKNGDQSASKVATVTGIPLDFLDSEDDFLVLGTEIEVGFSKHVVFVKC
jgi:hypothetical protein